MDNNSDRLHFPRQLMLHLVDDATSAPAKNITVTLRLFARKKNDYDLGPPLSNDEGNIVITEDWVREGIEYEGKTFIMDYASTMEDCLPQVRIKVLSGQEISNAMKALQLYGIQNGGPGIARGRSELMNARNELYEPQEIYIDLSTSGISTREVEIRLRRLK